MVILEWIKGFMTGSPKITPEPKVIDHSVESIDFPDTWKAIDLHHSIPPRSDDAVSGAQFANYLISNLSAPTQKRDDAIYQQLAAGNLPDFMRKFKQITLKDANNELTYWVSPDVLCIGNDDDFLRITLNGYTARQVADLFGCMLPTKLIADQIWTAADLKMTPTGMGASFEMINSQTLVKHNNVIEKQRAGKSFTLITGHKKDVIYAKYLLVDKSRISIYGWFSPLDGKPIQGPMPNSTSHSITYLDYSQALRMVSRSAILNGTKIDLIDILANKSLSYLISHEGAYDATSIYTK